MKIKTFEQLNTEDLVRDLWNPYMAIVDIIDGIISEEGELSDRYWKKKNLMILLQM